MHSVRAVPATALPAFAARAAGRPAARPPLRAAGRERGLPGRARPHPDPAARRRTACSARAPPPCTPPTSPTSDRTAARRHRHRASASARPPNGTWPTASARPGALVDAGVAALPRLGQPRGHRPVRGGPRGRAGRAAARRAPRPLRRRPSCWPRPPRPGTRRSAGPTPARIAAGARADLVTVRLDTVRTAGFDPADPAAAVVFAATAADVTDVVVDGRAGRPRRPAPARRRRARRARPRRSTAAVGDEPAACAASASWSPTTRRSATAARSGMVARRRARRRGRPGRLGRPGRRAPRPPTGRSTPAARAVIPGFVDSHAHLVFAGDRAAEFAARMAGRAVHRRRHPHHGRRDPGRHRRRAAGQRRAGCAREALRQGTTTIEIKSGYGLTVADEARSLRHRRASSPPRPPSSARTWCRPSTTAAPTTTSAWSAARCSPPPRRTPAGSTCSASAARSTRDQARAVLTAGIAAGLLPRIHANQLGPGPGVRLAVELGRGQRRPLHPPVRRRRRRAGRLGDGGHAAARRRVLHPVALPGRPRGCSTPASRSRWPPTATPARRTRRRCRSASRSPSARCG